jgi:uncharacterized membrane protein
MKVMKRFVFLVFFLLFTLFPTFARADEGWVIDDFQSDIALQDSGNVRVVETIQVDFKYQSKHGIYRDIPYEYESDGKKTYTAIDVASVLQNNSKATYQTSLQDGYVRIKIGDADKTISGKNIYIITYNAKGVLRSFADHDELYWNVTGNNWPVAITQTEATVTLPRAGLSKVACFEGYAGSQGSCDANIESNQLATFYSTGTLDESKGLTAVVGYTKGLVPIVTVERPKSFWEKFTEWPSLMTVLISLLFGIGTVIGLWLRNGRDYWFAGALFGGKDEKGVVKPLWGHETITVEFTPPENLRPAEIGVLMDERADTTDVVSTLIDLATRGYLTITEIPKKWVFGKVDYQLTKKNPSTSSGKKKEALLGYESMLLSKLFKFGDTVKMSALKTTFYDDLAAVKKELYREVVAKNLFAQDPESVRGTYLAAGIIMVVLGGVAIGSAIGAEWVFVSDILLGLIVSGVALIIASRFMPRRTAYGRELYRRVKGYRLFINTAEKYRQRFFEKKNMFNEVLPYAIMFGLTAKFARQMHEMGIEPSQTGWYSSNHAFNTMVFASNMNNFSSSMSSAIASTPSSSGGFSGGGSSGGGFGGGGGGSW